MTPKAKETRLPLGPDLTWSRRQRLQYIEALAYWRGTVRRADLLERFDIGVQRVSDDIREYLRRNRNALTYDRHEKIYRAAPGLKLIFGNPALDDALGLLGPRDPKAGPWFDHVQLPIRQMKPRVLQAVFRAVAAGRSIRLKYASLNSASFRWRWVTPHAFAHDGFRWHLRAFCHEEHSFKDFVLGRISATGPTGLPAALGADDLEWSRVSEMRLAAAPTLSGPERRALQLDFGLSGDRLEFPVRTALVLYVLAQFGLNPDGGPLAHRFYHSK